MSIFSRIIQKAVNQALQNPDKNLLSQTLYEMISNTVVFPEKSKETYEIGRAHV